MHERRKRPDKSAETPKRPIGERKPFGERLADTLDLPKDILLGLPRLIFTGNRELFIENYRGIVEYSDTVIRLNTSECMLKVSGTGLGIKNIAAEEIMLFGTIKRLEFI